MSIHEQHVNPIVSTQILAAESLVRSRRLTAEQKNHNITRVITYGTFDLLHYGHIRLLKQASKLGDYLIVGLSTDEFNQEKGKHSFYSYDIRKEMLESIRYVDLVIPETNWDQKPFDISTYAIDILCMGGDWKDDSRFEALRSYCDVVYLERTPGISTTTVKRTLGSSI